jgi:hypothetical protein
MRTGVLDQIYSPRRKGVNATAQSVAVLMAVAGVWLGAQPSENRTTESCDPVLTRLFAPLHPRLGRYEVCTSPAPLATLASAEWRIEGLSPLDAFGSAGAYDRAAISRLYGGRQARVARGWRDVDGASQSVTLVSPYPDATLTHLEPGTLIIRLIGCCR